MKVVILVCWFVRYRLLFPARDRVSNFRDKIGKEFFYRSCQCFKILFYGAIS